MVAMAFQPWQAGRYLENREDLTEEVRLLGPSSVSNLRQQTNPPTSEGSSRPLSQETSRDWEEQMQRHLTQQLSLREQRRRGSSQERGTRRRRLSYAGAFERITPNDNAHQSPQESIAAPTPPRTSAIARNLTPTFDMLAQHRLPQQLQAKHARMLKAREDFIKYTVILGYMPYNKQHKFQTQISGQDTISLAEALNFRAMTATQPGTSSGLATSHYSGAGDQLSATGGISGKLEDKQTEDSSHKEKPSNHEKMTKYQDGSSTSNPTNYRMLHVLLGDPQDPECAICLDEFMQPGRGPFPEVARIRRCRHYFHPKCIYGWMVKQAKLQVDYSCPYCCQSMKPT
ncbi:hypothetical protein PTTG_26668 [Puccinia triticina 1-1 BBBD Race 1]|uniref:RING-type domain-containing protein n=1 Tax=Puccinia triticina (isolate 1-1 / race 1 (BBBD)) TaxID=630390 RepID=A0A180GS93_PUCT1|nr:hypothetical protein PTTG_26668 [Puccinia triticina 1-1 BBBD Race 1]